MDGLQSYEISSTDDKETLTVELLLRYKPLNLTPLPDLNEYHNTRIKKNNWKRLDNKPKLGFLNKNDQNENDKLYSQFRGILNKLSESNFDSLAKELLSQSIKKREHLDKLAELIFSKAIIETKFSDTYAKLSKELSAYYIKEEEITVYFRDLLINRCQKMFIEASSSNIECGNNPNLKTKEQVLGCITFVGDLFNNELLTKKIIFNCFQILFMNVSNKNINLESLCNLMRIVGKNFCQKCKEESLLCFNKFDELIQDSNLSKKEKFMIMDILDLKKQEKW